MPSLATIPSKPLPPPDAPIGALVGTAESQLEAKMRARGFVQLSRSGKGRDCCAVWKNGSTAQCVESAARDGVVVSFGEPSGIRLPLTPARVAKLYFRYAAMNAGKSTALLQAAHNYEERGMRVRLFTAALDDRGGRGRDRLAPGPGAVGGDLRRRTPCSRPAGCSTPRARCGRPAC